jgi:uncharacterized protein (DUF169 family)
MNIDLSVFNKFNFTYKPIGVKFLLTKPEALRRLEKKLAFCEMLKEAQNEEPFYSTKEEHECKVGPYLLGMIDSNPISESGQIGPKLQVYEDPRANRRLYERMPKLGRDTVNYVAFSSIDKLEFKPDLLIVTTPANQAEIILRAYSYRTGAMWHSKSTLVTGCAWLYMHPYINGELNFMVTGLYHGMKARHLFPEGLLFISIPYDQLPEVVENLKSIQWELPQYSWGKEEHLKRMKQYVAEVVEEMERNKP